MCRGMIYLISTVLSLGLLAGPALADLIVAERLLVDLRAEDLAYGEATSWPNRGTLGDFTASGTPLVQSVAGMKCVTFDGSTWFTGPASVPGIEGAGTRSIEVWAYNPSMPGEETILSWAHRGGPEGSNMSFNYGNDSRWGAVGHWGGDTHDMGWWGTHSPAPAANTWWHLAYTYDGTAARVYVNGVEESVRDPIDLDTYGGTPIRVAAQADGTGLGADSAFNFTGSIAEVRIHDGVLSPADIMNNFKLGGAKKAYDPDPPDGADDVTVALLQWKAGLTATHHDVYFGIDPDALEFVVRNLRVQMVYYHQPGITPGTTYYWRVDEVEADGITIHTGDVWSFTAAPLAAYHPDPPDGAKYVATDADLSWAAGTTAFSHDVYFGTVEAEVADGTGDTFKANQQETTYDPGPLAEGTTYYWRVDEVEQGGAKHRGPVWRFSTVPVITVTDPNLVGWWKFDEGRGTTAFDWSGQGNHGDIRGGTAWVDGYDGGALRLQGVDGYVNLPIGSLIATLDSATFTTWVNFSNLGGAWQRIFDFGSGTATYIFLCPRTGTGGPMRVAIQTGGGGESLIDADSTLATGWHHVAVAIRPGNMQIYLDGALAASGSTAVIPSQLGQTTNNWLGRSQYAADGYFNGSLDDFRIYNYAMPQGDIPKTMRGDTTLAWDPSPANESTPDVDAATPLSWQSGDKAAQHDVYFGTDEDAVDSADASDTTGIYRGQQAATTYSPSEALRWGQTYYWRIDEVNTDATISRGRVWSFTVADYLIPDDFESYDDYCNRIFYAWKDGWGHSADPDCGVAASLGNGTGSTVGYLDPPFAEQTIVHSGGQSMPFEYNNTGANAKALYSEAEHEWAAPQDWTREGVKALTLWFYGDAANSPETLYVAVQDSVGTTKVVSHPNRNAVLVANWQEWNIDLTEFSNAGVNLASVKKMYIGVGNRTTPQAGGTGMLYIDDIRLYQPRCMTSLLKPEADLDDNCAVDYWDVMVLAERWLDTGVIITPANPGNANLAGHWKLDDGFGSTAADSSTNANNGTVYGEPQWVTGHDGGALWFDGTNDYVELPIGWVISSLSNSTFATWADFSNAGGGWQRIFDFGNDTTTYMFLTPRMGTGGAMRFGITTQGGGAAEQVVTAASTLARGWHHVAVTINANQDTITLYLDGSVAAQNTAATLTPSDLGMTAFNWLGRSQYEADAYYTGLIDDFRIYSRALSQAEVAWLAGRTSPFWIDEDLYQDGTIDFKDFAVLADSWLDEQFWPQP